MKKTKYLTKGTNIKRSFYDGAENIKLQDGIVIIVNDEENMIDLKMYINEHSAEEIVLINKIYHLPSNVIDQ